MTAIPLDAKPLPCTTKAGRQLASFLIDSRRSAARGLVRELTIDHLKLCETCPIKDACWAQNGDEDWVQRLQVEEYQRAKAAQR